VLAGWDRTLTGTSFPRQLVAARSGDPVAFGWLWHRYAGQIAGFLRARGTDDVDQLVNDVFAAAFAALARFEGGEEQFRAWLYCLARNRRVDAIRAANRRPRLVATAAEVEAAPERCAEDAETVAIEGIVDERLQNLLADLTPEQRDVIVLRFISDLSLEQTAAVLDKPVGAVKALQHRAIERLRRNCSRNPYLASWGQTFP
jgi:RNA polymerase sigma-70 factor (ECF subfamily)